MTLIIFLTSLTVTLLFLFLIFKKDEDRFSSDSSVLAIVLTILIMVDLSVIYTYLASAYKAETINKEYNTNYTQEDVFYSYELIEQIHISKNCKIETK